MTITVEIKGLKGVEDALAEAGPKLAKRALRKSLKAGAKVFIDETKRRAPVATGALRDAITEKTKMSPKQERGSSKVGIKYGGKGAQDPGVYGRFQEFGTIKNPAQPFMRPAFDTSHDEALKAFTDTMQTEVGNLNR